MAPVMNENWGFIDATGKTVLPFVYIDAQSFREGMALVKKDNAYFFINAKGKKVKELENPEEMERKEHEKK
jgi:hypothetical protein